MEKFEALTIDQFKDEFLSISTEMGDLLSRKRQSYGPHNLTKFGLTGIVIRAGDKIERLATMTQKGVATAEDGDGMEDALMDLIGYGVLGLMYYRLNVRPEAD